jgi:hypothetical protein
MLAWVPELSKTRELLTMKSCVVVLVWVDVTVVPVVLLEDVADVAVRVWPPPQAQHISNAVKSESSKESLARAHHAGADS